MNKWIGPIAGCLLISACGDSSTYVGEDVTATSIEACSAGFVPAEGAVAVNFRVVDRFNRVYEPGDLKVLGSFLVDPVSRMLTFDPYWTGGDARTGWPTLYDDGPWTMGGHEPVGARAGDHVWGYTAFVMPPEAGSLSFQFGVSDESYQALYGSGWIWQGPNGAFVVEAGDTATVNTQRLVLRKFGRTDLRFEIDTNQLAQFPGWTWDSSFVAVKSSWWGWGLFEMTDEGDGVFALELDALLETGVLENTGLLRPGGLAEFVFVFGAYEYKAWGVALSDGVTVSMRCLPMHSFVAQPIELNEKDNTFVVAPRCGFMWRHRSR